MNKKHINIPIFIPELACPFRCIYCDQCKISGSRNIPDEAAILDTIRQHLKTVPADADVQLAYFGGNFTGLPLEKQDHYLSLIQPFIERGVIQSIRLSTRPDYINRTILDHLKRFGVESIELGAQSMDNSVLLASARGHTAEDTVEASRLIREYGFSLGLQMMIGLPGDDEIKSMETAQKIIDLGAGSTRIYPTLVISGTRLETLYREKKYHPLTLGDAVFLSKAMLQQFEKAGVTVLRIGLHPSEGLLSGESLVAGPFHPSFRELVETELWNDLLLPLKKGKGNLLTLYVAPEQRNVAIGYKAKNRKMLLEHYPRVRIDSRNEITGRDFHYAIRE
jgi:histone acetyltransferase (RNA polymerase elongator complex component)